MLKGWRTIVFNAVMTLIMTLSLWSPEQAANLPGVEQVNELINESEKLIATIWGFGNVVLRAITNTPLGKKDTG